MKLTGSLFIGTREVPATHATLMALNPATNVTIAPEFVPGCIE